MAFVVNIRLGLLLKTTTKYSFSGLVLETKQEQTFNDVTTTVHNTMQYDHAGRLLTTTQGINSLPSVEIASMEYDELGQLAKKILGDSLQEVDYQYNIRGWLTHMNNPDAIGNDLYAQELTYNNPISGISGAAQYNGTISAMRWVTQNSSNTMEQYVYGYEYDDLNRITKGDYSYAALGSSTWNASYEYDLFDVKYDKNGNITYLERGQEPVAYTPRIDKLTYDYTGTGNQLKKVTDAGWLTKGFNSTTTAQGLAEQYTYDKNGNLKTDQNKDINDIAYNHLNLPIQVSLAEGANKINYLYDAAGTKYKKTTSDGNGTRYYFSNFEYDNTMALDYIHTGEGRIRVKDSYTYDYFLKDHLGNTRVVFTDTSSGSAVVNQISNYYPFGMRFNQSNTINKQTTQYLYNGKELQEDFGLNLSDYGWRMYDPALGRFSAMDPRAEKYEAWSPYNYVANNPILNIDPNGDTIRVSDALLNNEVANRAYNLFINSKEGQAFSSLFGEGGKFGTINVTFGVDQEKVEDAKGDTRVYATNADGESRELGLNKSLDKGENLSFEININPAKYSKEGKNGTDFKGNPMPTKEEADRWNYQTTRNKASIFLHESQHVDIITRNVKGNNGTYNIHPYYQHTKMKDVNSSYYKARLSFLIRYNSYKTTVDPNGFDN